MIRAIRLYLFCLAIAVSTTALAAEPPKLALAKRYHDQVDVTQYFVSEKLDGVRGYWDGTHLYTRNGNRIHSPPGFTRGWPQAKLDGELWIGRERFEEVSGIVRRQTPIPEDWEHVHFMVFDLHDPQQPFTERLKRMEELIALAGNSTLQLVIQQSIRDTESLHAHLQRVTDEGGEGLMLHRKDALYKAGRSNDILKLKPLWDAEARVIGHVSGKGKCQGMLGSLLVEGISEAKSQGKRFRIGTGFTDDQRRNPPAIGDVVTYQFQGYTGGGLPRFASFLKIRRSIEP